MSEIAENLLIKPREFFREKVSHAISNQKLKVSEDVEFYLVNLLCDFISPLAIEDLGEKDILEIPLAEIFKLALESPPEKQVKIYKILGDTSLYVSGYFQDYFNRKTYDIDYYITLGSTAYSSVSDLMKSKKSSQNHFSGVYSHLSKNFHNLVEVVAEVSDLLGTPGNENLLAIYDRWTKNKSERLKRKLENSGISPIDVNTKVTQ